MRNEEMTIRDSLIATIENQIENHFEYTLPDIVGKSSDVESIDTTALINFAGEVNNLRELKRMIAENEINTTSLRNKNLTSDFITLVEMALDMEG
jgi:hypothetical protein